MIADKTCSHISKIHEHRYYLKKAYDMATESLWFNISMMIRIAITKIVIIISSSRLKKQIDIVKDKYRSYLKHFFILQHFP